ncbi:MAG: DUF1302 family protein [Colwellia sp.]
MKNNNLPFTRKPLVASLLAAMLISPSLQAVELDFGEESELSGAINFTLGYAGSVRATDADKTSAFNTLAMVGEQFSYPVPNLASEAAAPDAGDIISNVGKATAEFSLDWRNYGFVGSVTYQYDSEIMDKNNGQVAFVNEYRNYLATTIGNDIPGIEDVFAPDPSAGLFGMGDQWSQSAEHRQGNAFDVLDAYFYGQFDIGDNPLEIRLGKQVINWGEGLFFLDGASQQVPLNISKLVTPGSELKEAYIGVESLYFNLGLGESSSLEAYYHLKYRRYEWPVHGTFYGDDILFRGSHETWNTDANAASTFPAPGLRGSDVDPSDDGQFGVAFRTMLGDVEVGVYYSRYHDGTPVLSFSNNSSEAAQFTQSLILDTAVNEGNLTGAFAVEALAGGDLTDEGLALANQSTSVLASYGASAGDGMQVHQKWIEDLDMLGASFATSLGNWSVAGEIAYRPDRPVYTNFYNHNGQCVEACLYITNGDSYEEHDSTHASVNGIWLGGSLPGGITSQILLVQVGADMLDGDLTNVMGHASIQRQSADSTYADSLAYGVSAEWTGTWQGIYPGTDLNLDIFVQKDIKGNSHAFGNFAEGRMLGAVTVIANIGYEWEASLGYQWTDQKDSYYDTQDAYNFAVNYKF